MREILFRGKLEFGDGWVYGYLVGANSTAPYTEIFEPSDGQCWKRHLVDLSTVGQYTGLKDKKGKRIFEGDILESQIGDRHRWIVSYIDGGFEIAQMGIKPKKRKLQSNTDTLCADNIAFYDLVVVGNIHDNPELLEESQ